MSTNFDIVIPVGPNEINKIHEQLQYTKKHVIGFRNIYIICYDPNALIDGCIMVKESDFPFTVADVVSVFARYQGKCNRNHWYYQQLLKLYCSSVIPDLLDHFLIIDADVYFLKPISFFENGRTYMNICDTSDIHIPYTTHLRKMHPEFNKHTKASGISHHMMFCKQYVKELFQIVEDHHHMPFWKVFLEMVDEHIKYPIEAIESGASEYEIYINFVMFYHMDSIVVRKLHWCNMPYSYIVSEDCEYDFISICHYWM